MMSNTRNTSFCRSSTFNGTIYPTYFYPMIVLLSMYPGNRTEAESDKTEITMDCIKTKDLGQIVANYAIRSGSGLFFVF